MKRIPSAAAFTLAWLLFAAAPLAAQTIISDTFTGTGSTAAHTPNTNLPGGTYAVFGSTGSATLTGTGTVQIGGDIGTCLPITSTGGYTEPTSMTISAGLEEGTTATGGVTAFRGIGLGFFTTNAPGPLPGNANAFNNFTGLVIGYNPNNVADPAVFFVNDVDKANTAENILVSVPWPTAALGAFSKTTTYAVSYALNTSPATGGISSVSVTNTSTAATDTTDFAAIDSYSGTNPFTTGAGGVVSYSGFMDSSGSAGTNGFVSNFKLAAPNK